MKVAILADFPLQCVPGATFAYNPNHHYCTWLPQVSKALADYPDLQIDWISLHDLEKEERFEWRNQTFHLIPIRRGRRTLTFYKKDRKNIEQLLRTIDPDVVHGWGTEDVYALQACLSPYPHLISMQGILSYYVLKNLMHLHYYIQAMLELFILRKAQCTTTESEWGKKILSRRAPGKRVELVEYGVQPQFLETTWQPDPEKPAAIFIGTINPRKGIQDAVQAFKDARLGFAELWVLGRCDSWGEDLQRQSTDNVKWFGRVSSAEAAHMLAKAWCLVLPTRADTSPNVVKEARVIGLPVISSPHGGQTSYIRHGQNGYLVEPGDIGGLTTALADVLSDLKHCTEMGSRFHEADRQALDPRLTASKFVQLYRELGATAHSRRA